jgi:cell wall-associated NlpC family hydrolase
MEFHRPAARHRAATGPFTRRALPAVSVGAAACAVLGLSPGVGHATPAAPAGGAGPTQQGIAGLYRQAAEQTQQYDAQEELIARLQASVDSANAERAEERHALDLLTGGLGRLAAQQYREPDLTSNLALLFAAHPDDYLERASVGDRLAAFDAEQIRAVEQTERRLDALATIGGQELAQLQAAQAQMSVDRTAIRSALGQARSRLDALDAADRRAVVTAVSGGEDDGFGTAVAAQAPPLDELISGIETGAEADQPQSSDAARAQRAIEAAYAELGKPYMWGAVGPYGFDCSGLMQHAWAQAGIMLPRTSQEQADAGPSVPLSGIQPGDLVIYFAGQTHVGMYVGDGLVIHAPRPGSVVQFAALQAMPIDKIVRPEGG